MRTCLRCPNPPHRRSRLCVDCHRAIFARGRRWCNRCRNEYDAPPSHRNVWCPDCRRANGRKYPERIPGYVPLAVAAARAHTSITAFRGRLRHGWPVRTRRVGWAWWVEDLPRYPPYQRRSRRSVALDAPGGIVRGVE